MVIEYVKSMKGKNGFFKGFAWATDLRILNMKVGKLIKQGLTPYGKVFKIKAKKEE